MNPMSIIHDGPAPYAPVAHVLRAIDHYREKAPPAVTKELLMRLGSPDAYATRTLKALRLLDLINGDGTPTDAFKELQRSTTDEYTARLEQVVRTAYAEVFAVVDPAIDSDSAIEDAFRFYKPLPQREKMVTLFMGICEAAGIIGSERAPRKRLRTVRTESGRKHVVDAPKPLAKGKVKVADEAARAAAEAKAAAEAEAAKANLAGTSSADALQRRYIEMLMKKADEQDEIDTGLLDRIEALLYEKGGNGGREE
jgi:hypothetical protein